MLQQTFTPSLQISTELKSGGVFESPGCPGSPPAPQSLAPCELVSRKLLVRYLQSNRSADSIRMLCWNPDWYFS